MRAVASCAAAGTRGVHAAAVPRSLAAPSAPLTSRLAPWSSRAAWGAAKGCAQPFQGAGSARQISASAYSYEAVAAEAAGAADIGEVDWNATLANSVRLIGYVGKMEPLKVFQTSKLQTFSLAIKTDTRKAAADAPPTWVTVEAWGPLGERAAEAVQTKDRVAVEGRLKIDRYKDRENVDRTAIKVVATSINRVRRTNGMPTLDAAQHDVPWEAAAPAAAPEPQPWDVAAAPAAAAPAAGAGAAAAGTKEELWMDLFENIDQWWDNRENKRNPKAPDFKKKGDKDAPALWISGRDTPNWVAGELLRLDEMRDGKLSA